jgi:hypothetical protein
VAAPVARYGLDAAHPAQLPRRQRDAAGVRLNPFNSAA